MTEPRSRLGLLVTLLPAGRLVSGQPGAPHLHCSVSRKKTSNSFPPLSLFVPLNPTVFFDESSIKPVTIAQSICILNCYFHGFFFKAVDTHRTRKKEKITGHPVGRVL